MAKISAREIALQVLKAVENEAHMPSALNRIIEKYGRQTDRALP